MQDITVKHLGITITIKVPTDVTPEQVKEIQQDLRITCVRIKNKYL